MPDDAVLIQEWQEDTNSVHAALRLFENNVSIVVRACSDEVRMHQKFHTCTQVEGKAEGWEICAGQLVDITIAYRW